EATIGANTIHAASSISNNSGATLEVTGSGVTLTIDNAVAFTNTGTLLATGQGKLILINDTTADPNGTVDVDANSTLAPRTTTYTISLHDALPILEATIGANTIHAASSISNNSGATLEVTGAGVTLTIDNAVAFTNTGTLLATGQGKLILINDTVADANGTVEVDASSTLELRTTTFNNGTFINSSLLHTTVLPNTIHVASLSLHDALPILEVTGAGVTLTIDNAVAFTNTGTLLATGQGKLILINDTVADANGTVEVDGSSTLELRTTTFNNGTFIN